MKRQQSRLAAGTTSIWKRLKNPTDFCENNEKAHNVLNPGEKVMSIYLIRRKIFREFSSAKELLICRLVCKMWETEATSALLQPKFERALQISFRYSETSTAFISNNWKNSGRSLGDFMQDRILARKRLAENTNLQSDETENEQKNQSPRDFNFLDNCCTFFKFQGGNLGADPDAIRFFMDPDSGVKSLTVDLERNSIKSTERGVTIENFRNLLLRWGKSIKYFYLARVPSDWRYSDSLFSGSAHLRDVDPSPVILLPQELQDSYFLGKFGMQLWARTPAADAHLQSSFPALEILKLSFTPFDTSPFVVFDLLRGAGNLKETHYKFQGDCLGVLETEKKLDTLRSWYFGPLRYESPCKMVSQLENLVKLKKFGILLNSIKRQPGVIEKLGHILKGSQKTLEVIYDPLAIFNCPGLIIPQGPFDKVKKVTQGQLFSSFAKMDLSKILPHVQHFKIEHGQPFTSQKQEMEIIDQLDLSLTSPLTSVSKCTIFFDKRNVSSLNEEKLSKIKRNFPNLNSIHVSTDRIPKELPQLLHLLFKLFPHACAISFKFRYKNKQDYYAWENFDEDFLSEDSWREQMDAVITGPAIPNQIQQAYEKNVSVDGKESEEQIQGVSILGMKDLQYFGMNFGFLFPAPRLFSQIKQIPDFQLDFQPQILQC